MNGGPPQGGEVCAAVNQAPLADPRTVSERVARSTARPGIFDKCRRFSRAQALKTTDFYPCCHKIESAQKPEVLCDGRVMIMMSSNDFLGLTNHPKVKQAAIDAIRRLGTGCAGSRFLNGTLAIHTRLEERLAEFLGKQAAVVFPTGFQANLGAISALVGKHELIIADRMNHASVFDGGRLSFGHAHRFRHNNIHDLARILLANEGRRALVVVDGVFGTNGEIADLPGLVDVCQRYGAGLMVDETHAIGVLGATGQGTGEHLGLPDDVDVVMASYSKSLATIGGCLAADADVIDYLKHHARSLIFSASLPPPAAAAALAALQIIEDEPQRRDRLWRNACYLSDGFTQLGFDTGPSETPIVPVIIGSDHNTLQMWRRLFDAGVFTSPALYPAAPAGAALIRTSCMATHTTDHLDRVLEAFERAGRDVGVA